MRLVYQARGFVEKRRNSQKPTRAEAHAVRSRDPQKEGLLLLSAHGNQSHCCTQKGGHWPDCPVGVNVNTSIRLGDAHDSFYT